jgi:predicted Ser/Thr protein kinase
MLDARYRVIGRLGRGGMGEVYRADDLRLGQPVALKFLPAEVDRDPARLTQLHTEVRMARQVSHPNVCRVYDIGEVDGHTFLSMEYVDGEDLASLVRRIGRFPQDRAIELARQICAGLAAAHDRGVVHRDLKPANIMLDGSGRIRITDFGLAGAAGETLRAGTPAYMAPEQLAGGEVTPRSDVYALGLVLYELFTGRRALEGANLAELIAKREQAGITRPTEIVRDLDPAIERAIVRCLEPDPAHRPASALSVAAALPGGDPLGAALAAGETPSPEMVAAAGTTDAVSRRHALLGAAWVVASLIAILFLDQRILLINRVPLPKPPDALVDRAHDIVSNLGYGSEATATAAGLTTSSGWERYLAANASGPHRWDALFTARPPSIVLWYRTSPFTFVQAGLENTVTTSNPPLTLTGMTLTMVDATGRLLLFNAVPETAASNRPHGATNWGALFEAAGLPRAGFHDAAPERVPSAYADERKAWEGPLPEHPDLTVHLDAAAYGGRPVFFSITGPWNRAAAAGQTIAPPRFDVIISDLTTLIMPALMVVAAILARVNVKRGRGDRRGAFRAAAALFFMLLAAWLLGDRHIASVGGEIQVFFMAVSQALYGAAVLWLAYLGLEPYVRRFAPDSLIGWTRLIAGGWRDPRVGRDVAIGIGAGLLMTIAVSSHNLLPMLAGRPEAMPAATDPTVLMTLRYPLAQIFDRAQDGITSAMLGIAGYTALLILLKRRAWAALAAIVCYTPVAVNGMFMPGTPLLDLLVGFIIITIFVAVIARIGLLATVACLTTHFVLIRAPLTTELSTWRATHGMIFFIAIAGLGLASCAIAAGRFQSRAVARFS